MEKKLHRIPDQAVFGGVAAGFAQYFNIDVAIVRVLFVIILLPIIPPGFGLTGFLYIILWAVLPTGPADHTATSHSNFNFGTYKPTDPASQKKRSEQTIIVLGGALIFFGVVMLVDDFPIWYHIKHYFWPVALIAVGAFLILRQRDKEQEKNETVYPTTPPPTEPVTPSPVEPDPQPYTPFTTGETRTHFPEDPENKKSSEDDDDQVIKVN